MKTPVCTRRRFVRLCASAVAAITAQPWSLAQSPASERRYGRVRLMDEQNQPLRSANLRRGENYVFHYPYATTPCFLIDLGEAPAQAVELTTEDGQRYVWQGGVGPRRSIVAFSAICAHRLTHPAPAVSFISYRPRAAEFMDRREQPARRDQVIYCCSEKSVYDATQGAKVLGGPAPQPLATILLEHDPDTDELHALGTQGAVLFDQFFDKFGFRLALEWQTDDIRRPVEEQSTVVPLDVYSDARMRCG